MEPNTVDVFLRQSLYYEAVKDYEADKAESLTDEVTAALLAVLLKLGFTSFAGVPKRKLSELLTKARDAINATLDKTNAAFIERMQNVLASVVNVTRSNIEFTSGKRITEKSFNGSVGGNKALWKRLTGEFIPATGLSPLEMIKDFTRSTVANVATLIKRAYAENWTVDELVRAVKGTASLGYRDGLGRKLANQFKTVTRTMMQHIQSFVDYELGRLVFDRYQWLSTIDGATTDICRRRHMRIYTYGKGPRPPAHLNCRSRIVGIVGDLSNQAGKSLYGWLRAQPAQFLRDVLTPAQAKAFADGSARSSDFARFMNSKRLTPAQFGRKVGAMQQPN